MYTNWRDIVEIMICSTALYWFSLWLKKDKNYNLLPYFYAYCILIISAQLLSLTTISFLLLATSPIAIMLFILFHQELLQRNFITIKKVKPEIMCHDWIESIFRVALITINNNKEINIIIERSDDLKSFLSVPFFINIPAQLPLLELITESSLWNPTQSLWINKEGLLVAINTQWNFSINESWQSEPVKDLPSWQQNALALTLKTDAMFCKANPNTRSFDIIIKGKVYESLPVHTALALIKKQLNPSHIIQGARYDFSNQRQSSFQQNP